MIVGREFTFPAAHHLPGHSGKCKNVHGHTYRLYIEVEGPVNSKTGMVIDFADLSRVIEEEIIRVVDHRDLNEVFNFIPTAENMVQEFASRLMATETRSVALGSARLKSVRLYENPCSPEAYAEVRY